MLRMPQHAPPLQFFSSRPQSACHVERAFSLVGHILTHDCLHMNNDTLYHLVIMCVNKIDKKRKRAEMEGQFAQRELFALC